MNELTDVIKDEIRGSGKITFERFMELALYHKEYGYYASGNVSIGREGDFYTSPYVDKTFGGVISNFILKGLTLINSPTPVILEIGGGKGTLAKDILDTPALKNPSAYDSLIYKYIENSKSLINQAHTTLNDHSERVDFLDGLSELENESIQGVVISNELFDAVPFHRMVIENGVLKETYITLMDDNLVESIDEPSTRELENYIEAYDIEFSEGQELEINLGAVKLLREMSRVLKKGLVLTIDYGYLASELYSKARTKGTYKCMKGHTINESPYIDIGQQDITAHVDFSGLRRAGKELGLSELTYTTQGQFLIDWGIVDKLEELSQSGGEKAEKKITSVKNLFLPGSMGNKFKVLIQEKGLSDQLEGFYPESPFKISFDVV